MQLRNRTRLQLAFGFPIQSLSCSPFMDTFKSHGIVRNEYNLTPVSSHLTNELLIHVVTREKKDLHFHMFNANIFVLLLNDFHE